MHSLHLDCATGFCHWLYEYCFLPLATAQTAHSRGIVGVCFLIAAKVLSSLEKQILIHARHGYAEVRWSGVKRLDLHVAGPMVNRCVPGEVNRDLK